jgi:hypothetical protein
MMNSPAKALREDSKKSSDVHHNYVESEQRAVRREAEEGSGQHSQRAGRANKAIAKSGIEPIASLSRGAAKSLGSCRHNLNHSESS